MNKIQEKDAKIKATSQLFLKRSQSSNFYVKDLTHQTQTVSLIRKADFLLTSNREQSSVKRVADKN
jgi:hypothetical protein